MSNFKIFLSAPPDSAGRAAGFGPVSIMGYRMGSGFHLYRTSLPRVPLEIMDIDCMGFTGFGPHHLLVSEIVSECSSRGYRGVSLGLDGAPTPQTSAFCAHLAEQALPAGIDLYLPAPFARGLDGVIALDTPMQGFGSFLTAARELVSEAEQGMAFELERLITEFQLPCRGDQGSVLSEEYFGKISRLGAHQYSPRLGSRYMTYAWGGEMRMVLWEDDVSLNHKLAAARDAGASAVFLYFPHVEDIIEKLEL